MDNILSIYKLIDQEGYFNKYYTNKDLWYNHSIKGLYLITKNGDDGPLYIEDVLVVSSDELEFFTKVDLTKTTQQTIDPDISYKDFVKAEYVRLWI